MKLSIIVLARNHEYGTVSLKDRAIFCLNSLIDTFDEVFYVDWGSPEHSLLYDIQDHIKFKGNLKHIVITPEIATMLAGGREDIQKPCEVLARNLAIARCTGDWIVSTNIDIICPTREELLDLFPKLDQNTMYTVSRRGVDFEQMEEYYKSLNSDKSIYEHWADIRDYLNKVTPENTLKESVISGDDYSIINCCGDFQCAPRHIWHDIRGFEEDLVYALYSDTNVQKKAVMHGYGLKALYAPGLYHINHGPGGGGFMTGYNPIANDMYRAVIYQKRTENPETWGFSNIEIEYEVL
jgi:hypothetical protein